MNFDEDLDREREHVLRLVRHAGATWGDAMRAHKMAPPDAGFAARLHALADAASTEQVAWEHAYRAGLAWQPVSPADTAPPPHELQPASGRRGPQELWARFDIAVRELTRAITEPNPFDVAAAFGEMAVATRELAEGVEQEDAVSREAHDRARARGAA